MLRLLIDYLDSLYQSIEYRKSRTIGVTIGVTIVATIGVEVLLALATGGAGNVARRAGQLGAKIAKAPYFGITSLPEVLAHRGHPMHFDRWSSHRVFCMMDLRDFRIYPDMP